jgi:hypothetical protein
MLLAMTKAKGYVQTKLVADVVLKNILARLPDDQDRISVVKPGRIIGGTADGVANTDDYLWRVVVGAISIGAFPYSDFDQWISIADRGTVSRTILSKLPSFSSSAPFQGFEDMTLGMSTTLFWQTNNAELHTPLAPLSWPEWIAKAKEHLEQDGAEDHPLWSVQDFLSSIGWTYPEDVMADIPQDFADHMTDCVKANFAYLERIGFVQTASDAGAYQKIEQRVNVVKRSKTFGVQGEGPKPLKRNQMLS